MCRANAAPYVACHGTSPQRYSRKASSHARSFGNHRLPTSYATCFGCSVCRSSTASGTAGPTVVYSLRSQRPVAEISATMRTWRRARAAGADLRPPSTNSAGAIVHRRYTVNRRRIVYESSPATSETTPTVASACENPAFDDISQRFDTCQPDLGSGAARRGGYALRDPRRGTSPSSCTDSGLIGRR
jgi:hypothetical protein